MKNKIKFYALLLSALFLALIGLWWIIPGILLFGGVWIALSANLAWISKIKKHGFLMGVFSIAFIFLLAICLRLFVFEIFSVPSPSMENTIMAGDKIVVSKLNYGPQLPKSPFEIPWVNILFYLNKEARAKSHETWWDAGRLNGYTKITRDDIVVFKKPGSKEDYIKRCVGLPGEEIMIRKGDIFIDNQKYEEPATVKRLYRLWANDLPKARALIDSLGLYQGFINSFEPLEIFLTQKELDRLSVSHLIDSLSRKALEWEAFPLNSGMAWTFDNMGPLRIPAAGMSIDLNEKNLPIYQNILTDYEGVSVIKKEGKFYVNGVQEANYSFKQNYYFMMGDNFSDSQDSRNFGFVPEQNVVGKAVFVLFSNDWRGFNFKRVFKKL